MSPAELDRLVRQFAEPLRQFASTWTTEAEDVIQEAFVDLWQLDGEPKRPAAWLFAAVRRRAISRLRSDSRRQRREQTTSEQCHRSPASPPAIVEQTDADERLRALVARLPPELREIVMLRTWGGLTLTEIAVIVESSPATVHRRYQDALGQLRGGLAPPDDHPASTPVEGSSAPRIAKNSRLPSESSRGLRQAVPPSATIRSLDPLEGFST